KEELRKKEQLKEAAAKKKEKLDDIAAKQRIKEKIKADQEERRLKAAKEKAEREGRAPPVAPEPSLQNISGPSTSKPASAYTEARLRLQTSAGAIQKTVSVDTTLFEVAALIEQEKGIRVQSFETVFPKKVYSIGVDFGQ